MKRPASRQKKTRTLLSIRAARALYATSFSLVLCLPILAIAQEAPSPDEQSSTDVTPGAKPAPVDPKFAEAKQRFLQGVALAKAGNCEGAISELRVSYELVARTNTLFNIAHCHEELFQYTLAIEVYSEFLRVADAEDPGRADAEATIGSLKNLLGTLKIASNVQAQVWLGDRRIGDAPGSVLIPGGRHVLELRADGYLPARQEIQVSGRQSLELSFELVIAQKEITITKIKSKGLKPAYFWGGTIASGVTLSAGLFFGLRAKLEDASARDIDPRLPRSQEQDDIELLANIADSLFIGAGVLAVGTTVLYFMTDWKFKTSEEHVQVLPLVGSDVVGLSVQGAL